MQYGQSREQMDAMNFAVEAYGFPTESGRATATLVMKQQGRKCLICYFDLDTGEKLMLTAWRKDAVQSFCARYSDLDLSMVEIGTRMEIAYDLTESGRSLFLYANTNERL